MKKPAIALFLVFAAACAQTPSKEPVSFTPTSDGIAQGLTFVAVRRAHQNDVAVVTPSQQTDLDMTGDSDNFYLAVHKDALQKKYFLSAYLKQLFPGAVSYGAASSLGTKIVQLKPQNGKLYAFNADDNHKTSDTFNPDLIIDAYPIVTDFDAFNKLPNAQDYYLIDPSAGQNHFNMYSDEQSQWGATFQVELGYGQRFRKINDGVTFELVFTGYSNSPNYDSWGMGENNTLRGSGTLGMSLREYQEGDGFQRAPYAPIYFTGDLELVSNTGQLDAPAAKWNIHQGMKPIVWKLSPQFVEAAKDPRLANIDFVAAVKAGVERWNDVFGFQALQAEIAADDDSFGDDDTNYLIYDKDPTFGAAFADWRTNPNTGEIRGASVYFNAIWIEAAAQAAGIDFDQQAAKSEAERSRPVVALKWAGMNPSRLCTNHVKPHFKPHKRALDTQDTPKEQLFQEFITHVVLHEVGHTLGLRHNFAGSLLPPSSSVMDYLTDADSLQMGHPGAYDTKAIQALYGLTDQGPAQPFCTDEDVAQYSLCNTFDTGSDPLNASYKPYFDWLTTETLNPDSAVTAFYGMDKMLQYWEFALTDILKFARDPSSSQQAEALEDAFANVGENKTGMTLQSDDAALTTINSLTQIELKQLYLAAPADWGQVQLPLPTSGELFDHELLPEVAGALANKDGLRSFATRRMAVDALKAAQSDDAYQALLDTQTTLRDEIDSLQGNDQLEERDLISRIQAAVTPYFKQ